MAIIDEGKQLRLEVTKLRPDKRRRYGAELRDRILEWVERAADAGIPDRECAKLLGMRPWRLRLWQQQQSRVRKKAALESLALVPVEITHEPTSTVPTSASLRQLALALVAPSGYRVEGLGLDQIIALLRELP